MYKVKLTKLKSNHNRLRTTEVEGTTEFLPSTGTLFSMTAPSLDPERDFRYIEISEILLVDYTDLEQDKIVWFNTLNSRYKLEVLEDNRN